MHDRLNRFEYILLFHKTHFQIQLIKFTGTTVGPGILVTKARGNLVIAVEPSNHRQLFELLRSLWQSIEPTRM